VIGCQQKTVVRPLTNGQVAQRKRRENEKCQRSQSNRHLALAVPSFTVNDLGRRPLDQGWDIHASRARWNDVEKLASYVDEQRRNIGVEDDTPEPVDVGSLTPEQRELFDSYIGTYRRILGWTSEPPHVLTATTSGHGRVR
jgi:hypothetical protein